MRSHVDPEWLRACPRYFERWTPAEERRLLALYTEASRRPKRVLWCGAWRTSPVYYVAKKLGRNPTAVSNRRAMLLRCKRRCGR